MTLTDINAHLGFDCFEPHDLEKNTQLIIYSDEDNMDVIAIDVNLIIKVNVGKNYVTFIEYTGKKDIEEMSKLNEKTLQDKHGDDIIYHELNKYQVRGAEFIRIKA